MALVTCRPRPSSPLASPGCTNGCQATLPGLLGDCRDCKYGLAAACLLIWNVLLVFGVCAVALNMLTVLIKAARWGLVSTHSFQLLEPPVLVLMALHGARWWEAL